MFLQKLLYALPMPTFNHELITMKITSVTVYKERETVTMAYTFYFPAFTYHICSRNAILALGISKAKQAIISSLSMSI